MAATEGVLDAYRLHSRLARPRRRVRYQLGADVTELIVHFPDGEKAIAVVRDYYVDFQGDRESIRLDMCQQATNTIKRQWPGAAVWYGERRLA